MRRDDGSVRVLLADVTGHGVGSAMVTAVVAGCYHALRTYGQDRQPLRLLACLHRAIFELCRGNYHMTAGLVELQPGGHVTWLNAGGPPIMVQDPDGATATKGLAGMALGSADFQVGQLQCDLPPGGRILMFTDGVVELPLPGGRQFGARRLKRVFEASHLKPLSEARASLAAAIREAQAGTPADDDLTYVLLERARPQPMAAARPRGPRDGEDPIDLA